MGQPKKLQAASIQDGDKQIMDELRREWHLDRKVTVGIIIALLANAGSSIWWASRLDYTVQMNQARITQTESTVKEMRDRNGTMIERLAKIEANQNFQNETLREIKDAIKNKP